MRAKNSPFQNDGNQGLFRDDPKTDYGGYKLKNPESKYALRNLPPTDDPYELEERRFQMITERLGKAPSSGIGMFQARRSGERWEKRLQRQERIRDVIGDENYNTLQITLGIGSVLYLLYLTYYHITNW
jgi:hypothetical protein